MQLQTPLTDSAQSKLPVEMPPDVQALLKENPELHAVAAQLTDGGSIRPSLQMLARTRRLRPDASARAEHPHQTAAFFDLDGTILSGSIIQHLTRQGFEEGHGRVSHVLQFLVCWVLYKLNLVPRVTMYRWGYTPCEGRELTEVQAFVDRCVTNHVKPRIFREARAAVAAHVAAGHRVVAITGAPDYAAAEICVDLGIHDLLATPTPLSADGRIVTDIQEPVCYSTGKLAYLHAYAAKHEIDLQKSFFYSDSASDVPVLKAVGRPRVVNPQWMLLPVAWRYGWAISKWKTHDQGGLPVAYASRATPPMGVQRAG